MIKRAEFSSSRWTTVPRPENLAESWQHCAACVWQKAEESDRQTGPACPRQQLYNQAIGVSGCRKESFILLFLEVFYVVIPNFRLKN